MRPVGEIFERARLKGLFASSGRGLHPLDFVLYAVAYYYVLEASLNDGFSGYALGIPYAAFLIGDLLLHRTSFSIKLLHIAVLGVALFFILFDRSGNALVYPKLAREYRIPRDLNYSYGDFFINELDFETGPYEDLSRKHQKIFTLKKGATIRFLRQIVDGHPDFGISYLLEIDSPEFAPLRSYFCMQRPRIERKYRQNNPDVFRYQHALYTHDPDRWYVSDYEAVDLLKFVSIPDPWPRNRFDSGWVYLSFYLFTYPLILGFFVILLCIRYCRGKRKFDKMPSIKHLKKD